MSNSLHSGKFDMLYLSSADCFSKSTFLKNSECQPYLLLLECFKEALAIRRIFSLVGMITKAKFSNSPNDFKIRLFG